MVHHEVGNILESDRALVKFASVFRSDAVHHASAVEGSNYFARPLLTLQYPAQKNSKNFVGIHKATVFGDSPNAIRVPVGRQPRMAAFLKHGLPQHLYVRLDRLGIDSRKQ